MALFLFLFHLSQRQLLIRDKICYFDFDCDNAGLLETISPLVSKFKIFKIKDSKESFIISSVLLLNYSSIFILNLISVFSYIISSLITTLYLRILYERRKTWLSHKNY